MDDRHPSVPNGLEHTNSNRPRPDQDEALFSDDLFDEDLEMDHLDMDLVNELLDEGGSDRKRDPSRAQKGFPPNQSSGRQSRSPNPPQRHPGKPQRRLAEQAARAGLSWGLQAGTTLAMEQQGLSSAPDTSAASSGELRDAQELLVLLARSAVEARREAEAEGSVAAMIPIALRLAPEQYRALWPAVPGLTQGAIGMARLLRRSRRGRGLLLRLPHILGQTVSQLARHAKTGQPMDERIAATLLAKQIHAGLQGRHKASGQSFSAPQTDQMDFPEEEWWGHDAHL